ncbi:MAG: hypothetical protein ACTSQE_08995, partial [Candidatus Heimdallarchaeaceae archaeon]
MRKKIVKSRTLLLVGLFLFIMIISSIPIDSAIDDEETDAEESNEIQIAYFQAYPDLEKVRTRVLLDNEKRIHVFIMILFENDTFVIKHIINGEQIEIARDIKPAEIFNAFLTSQGVVLFYTFLGQFGQLNLYMYKWLNGEYSNIKVYSPNVIFGNKIVYNIQQEGDIFHLLLGEAIFETAMDEYPETKVKHLTISLNGSYMIKQYVTDLLFSGLESLHYLNGEIIALFKYMFFPERAVSVIVIKDEPYLSNVLWFTTDYDVHLSICNSSTMNLALIKGGYLYTHNFGINETLSFDNFTKIEIEMYSYIEFFSFAFSSKVIFLFNPDPHVSYSNKDAKGELETELVILNFNGSALQKEKVAIPLVSNATYVDSSYIQFYNNSDYIASITHLDAIKYYNGKRIVEKSIFSIKTYTNTEPVTPNQILFNDLTLISPFQYFWQFYWPYVVIPSGILILVTLIFFQKLRVKTKKVIKYLFRPVKPGTNKFILLFINLWIYLHSVISLPLDLWKSNKKRALISILGLAILSLIILSSTTLFTSKQNLMIAEYLESADIQNNEKTSVTFSRMHNVLSARWGRINEYSPFFENFSHAVINEILSTIATQTIVLKEVISDVDYSTHMRILMNKGDAANTQSVESYYGLSFRYEPLLKDILVEGRLPSANNEIIIDQTTAEGLEKQVNDTLIFVSADFSVGG